MCEHNVRFFDRIEEEFHPKISYLREVQILELISTRIENKYSSFHRMRSDYEMISSSF